MKNNIATLTFFLFVFLLGMQSIIAQEKNDQQKSGSIRIDDPNYEQLKASGKLEGVTIAQPSEKGQMIQHIEMDASRGNSGLPVVQSAADCDCWIPMDGSFSVAPICQGGCLPPDYRNDDGSTAAITLPFNFCLNNTTQSTVYINNNGNVSFGSSYGTFSAVGFPSASYVMIAPFWADVDTRNVLSGLVYYKITPTYMIVQWDSVGYFSQMVDKRCTFQLIMTNGSDPIIPGGKNVSFCYKNMDWTTGSASGGVNGFGGTAATVGVNFGDGVNYIQLGRFDQAGAAYDGPYGSNDGVDWLDNQHFDFDWCSSTNIAPVLSNPNFCDTVTVCVGTTINPTLTFLSPEGPQTTSTAITSTLSNWSVLSNTPGNSNYVSVQITAMIADTGFQTMTFTATDDGVPPASTIFSILVHVLPSPTVNAGPDTSYCTIPVQLNAVGSAGVTSYSWSPAAGLSDPNIANPLASPSSNTTYIVTVSNGTCSGTDTMNIIGGVGVATVSVPVTICQGANTQLTSGGGTIYSWSPATGLSNPNISNPVATPATTTTYTVTVSTGVGCSATATTTVTVSPTLIPSLSTSTNVTCFGLNNGTGTVSANGGTLPYTYLWSNAGGTNASATGLQPITYVVTITDVYGCSTTQNVPITEPPVLAANINPPTNVSCNGGNNGSATVVANGGTGAYSYAWLPTGGNAATASNLIAGNYNVTVTDANGCSTVQNVTIAEPTVVTAAINPPTNVSCNGGNNGSATAVGGGGTGAYSYVWTSSIGIVGTTVTASNLNADTYTVLITDANGCTQTASVTITEPTALNANINPPTDVSCNGGNNGSATVVANGGTGVYGYAWLPTGGNAATASNLIAGNYNVTVTDANGCSTVQNVTIAEPTALIANINPPTNVSCNGGNDGSAMVVANGGTGAYGYAWLPTGGNGATASNLIAGNYNVTVTDANGCSTVQNVVIAEPALLITNISATIDVSCNGGNTGSATVNAGGGTGTYNYAWLPSGGNGATASNLAAGNYTVTVTDANGCTSLQNATIYEPTAVTLAVAGSTTICIGQSAYISAQGNGGTAPLSYAWDNSVNTFDQTVSPTTTTNYCVVVTDGNGCSPSSQCVLVTVNPPLNVNAAATPAICFGNSASISASAGGGNGGPYSYSWNNGAITNANATVIPDHDTTFTVEINDGCSPPVQTTVNIIVNALPVAAFSPLTASGCPPLNVSFTDNSVTAPGSNYQWNFGDNNSSGSQNPSHVYSETGLYNVSLIVITPAGCSDTLQQPDVVTVLPIPTAMFSMSDEQISMYNPVVSFTDLSSGASWQNWDFGDGMGTSDSLNPVYQYSSAGLFTIQLIVENNVGCFDTAFSILHVTNEVALYVPTGFTPNGDGINDYFTAYGNGISEFSIYIFDRWGTQVFHSNNRDVPWNGSYNSKGELCPNDVYVYKITYKDVDGITRDRVGHVALTR